MQGLKQSWAKLDSLYVSRIVRNTLDECVYPVAGDYLYVSLVTPNRDVVPQIGALGDFWYFLPANVPEPFRIPLLTHEHIEKGHLRAGAPFHTAHYRARRAELHTARTAGLLTAYVQYLRAYSAPTRRNL